MSKYIILICLDVQTKRKIYSSLVSGGRFAAAVWADATKVPIISLATRVISSQVQISAPTPRVPNPFSLVDTNKPSLLKL